MSEKGLDTQSEEAQNTRPSYFVNASPAFSFLVQLGLVRAIFFQTLPSRWSLTGWRWCRAIRTSWFSRIASWLLKNRTPV